MRALPSLVLLVLLAATPALAQGVRRGGDPGPVGRAGGGGNTTTGVFGHGPDRVVGETGRGSAGLGLPSPGTSSGLGEVAVVSGDPLRQRTPGYTGPKGFLFPDELPRVKCDDAPETLGIEGTFGCLSPETYAPRGFKSWLRLNVEPRYAQVFVNGEYAGTVQQFSQPYRRLQLQIGPQFVELRAPGYEPLTFWIRQERDVLGTFNGHLKENRSIP